MKTHKITMLVVATLCYVASFAQQLSLDNVPQEVQSAFREKFPAGSDVVWGLEPNGNFEAKFMLASAKQRAEFDAHGKWIETENAIPTKDVPKNVHDAVIKAYPTCKISDAEKVQTDQGEIYEVGCMVGKLKEDIRVTATGKVQKKIEKKY